MPRYIPSQGELTLPAQVGLCERPLPKGSQETTRRTKRAKNALQDERKGRGYQEDQDRLTHEPSIPRECSTGLILNHPRLKEVLLLLEIDQLAHPRERVGGARE